MISIITDESDSDVEFLREEQDDNMDVILVSHTAPTKKPTASTGPASTSDAGSSQRITSTTSDADLGTNFIMAPDVDSGLDVTEPRVTSPLNLSKVPQDEDFHTGHATSSESSCDPESSDCMLDDSSLSSNSVSSDAGLVQKDKNVALNFNGILSSNSVSTTDHNGNSSMIIDQSAGPSNYQWNSAKLCPDTALADVSAGNSGQCGPETALVQNSVKWCPDTGLLTVVSGNDLPPNRATDIDYTAPGQAVGTSKTVDIGDLPKVVNSQSASSSVPVKRSKPSVSDTDTQMQCCSNPKIKKFDNISDVLFDLDTWDAVKNDLDFLNVLDSNSLSDPIPSTSNIANSNSLSNTQHHAGASANSNDIAGSRSNDNAGQSSNDIAGQSSSDIAGQGSNDSVASTSNSNASTSFSASYKPLLSSGKSTSFPTFSNHASSSSFTNRSNLPPKKQIHNRCFSMNSEPSNVGNDGTGSNVETGSSVVSGTNIRIGSNVATGSHIGTGSNLGTGSSVGTGSSIATGSNSGTGSNPGTGSSSVGDSGWGSESCVSCMVSLLGSPLSRCLQGHATCSHCLQECVKLVLTGKSKVYSILLYTCSQHLLSVCIYYK